ncbi:MAG: AAA family ATPase [Thermodesulfobacteriota bacterium]
MVPLKLSLKNFLSYGENTSTLDFRGFDIACLSGKNGHGKSALIDALTWALWGKCRVKIKDEVIKRGASEARVELEFESENNIYRILRVIERKKNGTSTSINLNIFDTDSSTFKPLDEGSKTQSTIEKLLKMDYNSFICSSFILQGMADEFTKRTASERKEILSKILALDEYELITKRARDHSQISNMELNALENQEKQIEDEISTKSLFQEKLKESKIEDKKLEAEISKFDALQAELIAENESLKAKLENLDQLKKDREVYIQRNLKLDSDLKQLTNLILQDKEIVSRENEIIVGFEKYELVLKQVKVLSEKELTKSRLEKDLESAQNLINTEKARLIGELNSLKTKEEEINKNLTQVRLITSRENEIAVGYKKFVELNKQDGDLEKNKNLMQDLDSKLVELDNKIKQKRIEIEASLLELKSKACDLKSKTEQKEVLGKDIKNLNIKLKLVEETQENIDQNSEILSKLRENKSSTISEITNLKTRKDEELRKLSILNAELNDPHCPLCESPLEKEAKEALIEKLETAKSDLETKILENQGTLEQIKLKEGKLLQELKKLEPITKNSSSISKELGEKEQNLKESELASKELEKTSKEIELLTNYIKDKTYIQEYSKALNSLKEKKSVLNYDSDNHKLIKKRLEKFRNFVTENEILKNDKIKESQYNKELNEVHSKIEPIAQQLNKENYSLESREKALKVEMALKKLSYDQVNHNNLREGSKSLEKYIKEKENLDKAKLAVGIREKEGSKLSQDLRELKKKLIEIESELTKMDEVVTKGKEVKQRLETSTTRINILKKNKNEILTEITRSENHLERIEKRIDDKKTLKENIKKTNRDLAIYKELVKAFGKNGLQALIIENAVPEIEIEANKILSKLTEGTMVLSLEMVKPTQTGGAKETLEIYIGDSSGTRSYETFSGGEAFRIDFALRVAISKFIANRSGAQLRTLVVDEGFGTQDKDGLDQFVQVLNIVKDDFDKILAITHVEELKTRFPVRIEVTKEAGQGSSFEVNYS